MRKILIFFIVSFCFSDLISPENGYSLRSVHILFEWDQEPDAINYNLQISNSNSFNNILLDVDEETTVYIEKDIIDWNNNYYWRVRPIYQNDTYGDWIDSYSFSTGSQKSEAYSINTDDSSYQDGVTIFSSFFNYYSAMIDQSGNEIWNTGTNDIVYYNTDYYDAYDYDVCYKVDYIFYDFDHIFDCHSND